MKKLIPKVPSLTTWSGIVTIAVSCMGTASASEHLYNFNPPGGDPNAAAGFILFGNNVAQAWQTNNGSSGAQGDGFLQITPAVGGTTLGIVFPADYFTNADGSLVELPLKGFLLEADARIGNATGNNGRPADGFSVSFAANSDPVIYWAKQGAGNFRGFAGGDSITQALEPTGYNFATGTGTIDPLQCDGGDAENGTKTGVSVQFDTWQGNTIVDENGQVPAAGNDNVGWRVHFNGKMQRRIYAGQLPYAGPGGDVGVGGAGTGNDLNGLDACPPVDPTHVDFSQDPACTALVCTDTNTIQTGVYTLASAGDDTNLCWTHFSVEVTTNSPPQLTVIFKGRLLVDHLTLTNYQPFVGRVVVAGRTGGANENRDLDNVHIVTYPSVQSVVGGLTTTGGGIDNFNITLNNVGPAKVSAVTKLTLDGTDITANAFTTISIADPISTVAYKVTDPTKFFASGSAHQVVITWADPVTGSQTTTLSFTTILYAYLPASASVPAASMDLTDVGFLIKPHQMLPIPLVLGGEPNRMYWADEQLEGLRGTNIIDFATFSLTNGEIAWNGVVDFANTGSGGQFPVNNTWDSIGVPGPAQPTGLDDNMAVAFTAYLYFPTPGTYVMGGNSDDGLRVTYAKNSHDLLGTQVPGLLADTGRGIGSFQNTGALIVTNAGYYGFRYLYENGGGGAGAEWYTTATPAGAGTNVLIGDVNTDPVHAIAVYLFSSAAPPYVSFAEPPLNDDQVQPNEDLKWQLTDASTTVASGSVALKLNGITMSPAVSAAGGVTTISLPHTPGTPWATGTNTVDLSFKDSANTTYAYNYTFVVIGYATIPASVSVAPTAVDTTQPGFSMSMYKVDQLGGNSIPNRIHVAEQVLAGLWGANKSTVSSLVVPGVINYDINNNNGGSGGADGDFTGDLGYPGLDTNNVAIHPYESFACEFLTWVVFPAEGTYRLGFNSDDGFRTMVGLNRPVNNGQLTIVSPASVAGTKLCVVASNRGDAVGTQPTTAVTGKLVLGLGDTTGGQDPTIGCGTNGLSNASAVAGNICLIERGTCGFQENVNQAAKAGAIAVLVANNRPIFTPTDGWFPVEMTGGPAVGIPAAQIDITNYFALTNAMATGTVTVTLNALDITTGTLGLADFGKGSSEVDYSIYVPAAGAYPLRTVYWQGGGGGNCEWTSLAPDGTRLLLNSTNAGALLAYRAATVSSKPTVSVGKSGGVVTITYTGTLQSSTTANGGWADVSGATNPYTVPVSAAPVKFYRSH